MCDFQVWKPSEGQFAYYVGESDNVRQRLVRHRRDAPKRFQGTLNAAIVAGLQPREKSAAKKVEASMIRALLEQVTSQVYSTGACISCPPIAYVCASGIGCMPRSCLSVVRRRLCLCSVGQASRHLCEQRRSKYWLLSAHQRHL
jgi:predicted GIY-YIG superfamily endonuclease